MSFTICQKNFEGPLDLLLELTNQKKLALSDVSLAEVANEYISYIKSAESRIDAGTLAEFLVVAAQLMLLKSRTLLPNLDFSEEEERSMEELKTRMDAYARVKILAQALAELEKKRRVVFTRARARIYPARFCPPEDVSADQLFAAYQGFLAEYPVPLFLETRTIQHTLSLSDALLRIQSRMQSAFEHTFTNITEGARSRIEIIVSFLALLELMRQRTLDLEQERPFEEIIVRKAVKKDSAAREV